MKRSLDIVLAIFASVVLALPALLLALLVRSTSPGPALYWSERVGRDNQTFRMPKFRSMRIDTPPVATHLLQDPDRFLTPIGSFYPSPGVLTEKMYAFSAYDLTKTVQSPDEGEQIELMPTRYIDALEMIRRGEIEDGKTIATLLMYALMFKH